MDVVLGRPAVIRPEAGAWGQRSASAERSGREVGRFFELSLDLLCIAGFDGYFKRLNPAWTRHLGWTLEELRARPFLDFVHPDDREATLAEVGKLAEDVETTLFENRYRHRDGSYLWLRWNARPVLGRRRIYATARNVTRQKRLERQILEIADRQQQRLGREMHDGLCQTLAGIAALSSTLSNRLAAAESDVSARADEITRLLTGAISEARNMAHGLGPQELNEDGLGGALERLASDVQHQFRVSCAFEWDRRVPGPDPGVEAHLFRIAQEAVRNGVTHGRAERIRICFGSKEGKGLLSVRDDGLGLPEGSRDPDGMGLDTMAYRARLIGGRLEVRRRRLRGTLVTCLFPLLERSDTREDSGHGPSET